MKIISNIPTNSKKGKKPSDSEIRKKLEELKNTKEATSEAAFSNGVRSAMPGTLPVNSDVSEMNVEKLKDVLKNNSFNFSPKEREVLDKLVN